MRTVPPYKLIPEPLDEEARRTLAAGFQWAKDSGGQHRLGGEPDFIQGEESPRCEGCGELMSFYAQLDSISDEYMVADCGMIYVFFCFDCSAARALVQSG